MFVVAVSILAAIGMILCFILGVIGTLAHVMLHEDDALRTIHEIARKLNL